ncbi:hypothetical protein K402DRAFT_391034 [Aulographum hederae CBS 113979]|uniref:Uncharacterized protein n=1 Tax=Aulographum hederae CBS 113979 TaxID=1176131 RepID=A0A6G1H8W3_9PEZI|nr:hypothetical protein K402DRAFT_391034 [Aulographum hederae CBS 113979]
MPVDLYRDHFMDSGPNAFDHFEYDEPFEYGEHGRYGRDFHLPVEPADLEDSEESGNPDGSPFSDPSSSDDDDFTARAAWRRRLESSIPINMQQANEVRNIIQSWIRPYLPQLQEQIDVFHDQVQSLNPWRSPISALETTDHSGKPRKGASWEPQRRPTVVRGKEKKRTFGYRVRYEEPPTPIQRFISKILIAILSLPLAYAFFVSVFRNGNPEAARMWVHGGLSTETQWQDGPCHPWSCLGLNNYGGAVGASSAGYTVKDVQAAVRKSMLTWQSNNAAQFSDYSGEQVEMIMERIHLCKAVALQQIKYHSPPEPHDEVAPGRMMLLWHVERAWEESRDVIPSRCPRDWSPSVYSLTSNRRMAEEHESSNSSSLMAKLPYSVSTQPYSIRLLSAMCAKVGSLCPLNWPAAVTGWKKGMWKTREEREQKMETEYREEMGGMDELMEQIKLKIRSDEQRKADKRKEALLARIDYLKRQPTVLFLAWSDKWDKLPSSKRHLKKSEREEMDANIKSFPDIIEGLKEEIEMIPIEMKDTIEERLVWDLKWHTMYEEKEKEARAAVFARQMSGTDTNGKLQYSRAGIPLFIFSYVLAAMTTPILRSPILSALVAFIFQNSIWRPIYWGWKYAPRGMWTWIWTFVYIYFGYKASRPVSGLDGWLKRARLVCCLVLVYLMLGSSLLGVQSTVNFDNSWMMKWRGPGEGYAHAFRWGPVQMGYSAWEGNLWDNVLGFWDFDENREA